MVIQPNKVGRYEILHELGRGAIGVVYAARDWSTGEVVALKTIDPALFDTPYANFAESVLKDARSARRLKHRNIVKMHDAGEAGGTAYVAMELLEGESLRKVLDGGPLSIARVMQIVDEIACGLAYAHEQGVVHRGLKPSNITVLHSGGVKITDFGIGHLGEAAILSGQRTGCLSCMSPEQVRGEPVDRRSDIFSLGAVFYELLTRRPAFKGDSPDEIVQNILHAEVPPPSEVNTYVPPALDRIVLRMLAGHPDDRLPDARALLPELRRLEEELGLGAGATAEADAPTATVPPPQREPALRSPHPNRFRDRAPMQDSPRFHRNQRPDGDAFDERAAMFTIREREPERPSGSRPAILAALALSLAVLAIGLTVGLHYWPAPMERRIAASGLPQMPATAPAPSPPPAPVAEAVEQPATAQRDSSGKDSFGKESSPIVLAPEPIPSKGFAAEPSPPAEIDSVVANAPEQAPAAGSAPAPKLPRATQATAKVPQQQPGGTARLIIAVSPQGEIYIDGKHYGTTPPITTLDLEPGIHRIEVRSGSRKPYLTYMTVQAGDVRRIRHDFDAKPSRPPA
jgi:eukaryotic-like serine/threonine-protein kinase